MSKLVEIKSGQVLTSSLQVAEVFGKRHDNVLRDIKNLEIPEDFRLLNFEAINVVDSRGKKTPVVLMTRDGFTFLVMGFTGEKATEWKIKYINAFNEMEKKLSHRSVPELVTHYVLTTHSKYAPIFPEEFFREIYRLKKWDWSHYEINRVHPQYVGQIIEKWIYGSLPDGAYEQIKEINPRMKSGSLKRKHHQYLTESLGKHHVLSHITLIIGLMRASFSWEHFEALASQALRKQLEPVQSKLLVLT